MHLAAESNTHLLSHFSVGQKSRHNSSGFSAQGPLRLISRCWPCPGSHLRVRVCFQDHSGYWQNSFPFDCRTQVPVFLLAVDWSCSQFLECSCLFPSTWLSLKHCCLLGQGQQENVSVALNL